MKSKRKFRRRTLRQWAAFVNRGRTKKPSYNSRVHLHRYEDEVILRKWAESGQSRISAWRLAGLYPTVFHLRGLVRAMKRMNRQGKIRHCGRSVFGGVSYERKEADAEREAA